MSRHFYAIRQYLKGLFLITVALLSFALYSQTADAATRTWDGGGTDGTCGGGAGDGNKWSCAANWSSDTAPTTADIATFDATSTKAATIDAGFTTGVTTFNMNAGYTGIITQARSFTVSANTTMAAGTFNGSTDNLTFTGTYTLSGGTFTGGNQTVQHTSTFTISSGTYTASSGTTTFNGAYTHTAGGTFTHNNGSVIFTGTATTTNVTTTENFYNLEVNKNTSVLMTISSGDTLIVNNTLTLTNGGVTTGTLNAKNTISLNSGWDGGGGTLLIDGSNIQTLSLNGAQAALASTITLNNTNFTFNGTGAGTLNFSVFNLQAGAFDSTGYSTTFSSTYTQSGASTTFTGGSGTITHTGTFTLSAGAYTATTGSTSFAAGFTHTAGGTFSHNNGTVIFTGAASTVDVASTETFYNLTLSKTTAVALTVSSGDTLICTNTLTLTDGDINTGTIEMQGTLSHASTYDGGTGTISITGSDVKTINLSTGNLPGVNLSNTNATLNASSSLIIESAYSQSAGTFNCASGTTEFDGNFTHSAGTFNSNSGSITVGGSAAVTWDVNGSEELNNFTVNNSAASAPFTIATSDTLNVNGTLTLTDGAITTGTLAAKGATITVGAAFGLSSNTSGTLTINGAGVQTVSIAPQATATFEMVDQFTINNSAATVQGTGATGAIGLDKVTLTAGTIDFTGYTLDAKEAVSTSGTLTLGTGADTFASTLTVANGTFNATSGTKTITGAFSQTNGTFNGNTATLNFSASFSLSGGIFNATSGTLTIATTFSHTTGTFNHNNGTVVFNGTTFTIPASEEFYDFNIDTTGTFSPTGGNNLIVHHMLSETNGSLGTNATITIKGDMNSPSTWDGVATKDNGSSITVNGTSSQSISIGSQNSGALNAPSAIFIMNNSLATVTGTGALAEIQFDDITLQAGTINVVGYNFVTNYTDGTYSYNQSGGTFTAGSGTVEMNNFELSGGTFTGSSTTNTFHATFTHTSGGTLNLGNSTVIAGLGIASTWDVNGSETFYDFTVNAPTSTFLLTIASGDSLVTTHSLTLSNGSVNTGTLVAQGDMIQNSTYDGGTAPLQFTGSATQTYTINTGAEGVYNGDLTVNKTGGAVNLSTSALTLNASGQDLIITSGTFDLSGQNLTVSGAGTETIVVNNTGNFQLQGGETVTADSASYPQFDVGSTVTYDGTSSAYTLANWTYTNATLTLSGGASSVFTLPGTKTFTNLTLTTGILSLNGNGLTVSGTFSNESTLRLRGSETVSLTMDSNSGITEYMGDGDAAADTFTLLDFGATDYYDLKISTTDATDIVQSTGTKTASSLTVTAGTFDGDGSTLDINGNVLLSAGTLIAPSGAGSFSIQASFTKSGGTFTHNGGTVTFDADANHGITGSVSWNSLTLQDTTDNATDVTLTIEASSTQTINGTLTLDGLDASDRLNIVSSTSTAATFDFQGSSTFSGDYLDVLDNTVSDNSSGISVPLNPANSVNSGNTTNWLSGVSPGVTVSTISGNTTEAGGTATFTVVLDTQPTNDVTIGISSNDTTEGTVSAASLTFTSGNYATPQTITVTGVNDDLDDGDIAYSIVTAAASSADGNYNTLNASDVSVTNTDNDASGFTVSAISDNVSEAGTTATYTIVITAQPTADVSVGVSSNDTTEGTVSAATLTFTSLNWATPQTITVTGANDFIIDGTVGFTIVNAAATSADVNYNNLNPTDVSVSCTDNDTAGITVSAISGSVAETGSTATYTINLTSQPSANVSIGISSNDTTEGTVSAASLTFTSGNWNSPQTITVTGVNDDLDDGTVSFSIINAAASSSDTDYNNFNPADVSVNCTDDDTTSITLTQSGGNTAVSEAGTTDSYTLVLTSQPTANVTVSLTGNAQITLSAATLTFTSLNWATPQTMTVTAVNDSVAEGLHSMNITHGVNSSDLTYNGFSVSNVSVSLTDNDTAGFTVSAASGNVAETGTTATYTVVLTSEPAADVSFAVVSSDVTLGTVSPASLTFTSATWNFAQTVIITGVNNELVDGTVALSSVNAAATSADANYNNLNPADVSLSRTDNDTAGVSVTESSGATAVTEGSTTDTYTLVLMAQPSADVTVILTGDSQVSLSASSLIFTTANWNTLQTVTITAVDDASIESNTSTVITHTSTSVDLSFNALTINSISVTVSDNDTATVATNGGGGGEHQSSGSSSGDSSSITTVQESIENDVPNHWANGYIKNTLEENFIIQVAIAQNSFMDLLSSFVIFPDDSTSRSNALTFLLVQSGIDISTITVNTNRPPFIDVSASNENYGPIAFAQQAGLVSGYADGSFQPNRMVNRAEALKLVFSFYKEDIESGLRGDELLAYYELEKNPFTDVDLNEWYSPYIIAAYSHGIVKGFDDGTYKPDREVSHAEFLKIAILGKDIKNSFTLASELE